MIERSVTLLRHDGTLHGTLARPAGEGPFDTVLLIGGSGPVDRNGNLPGMVNNHLRLLAEGLAAHGIASLRTDKRGIGESGTAGLHEENLRIDTYVEDVAQWLAQLRTVPSTARLFALGHSEGALIATMATQRHPVDGLILLAGAGRPVGQVLREQLASLPPPLLAQALDILNSLECGEGVTQTPPELASLFRPSVQPYLISWFRLDPRQALARVPHPTLIAQGTTDLQVSVQDGRELAAARPGSEYLVIEGMNHVLKEAPTDRAANLATYNLPGLPLARNLVPAVARFILNTHR